MPKIDIAAVPAHPSNFPGPLRDELAGRTRAPLGNAVGLTQFGVNYCRLDAGARSSFNHWHESEDEFVFVVSGDVVLIEGDTETPLKTGDAAGFKAGEPVGHNIENRSDKPAILLEIGTRAIGERCHYPGRDLIVETINSKDRVMTREGIPYPGTASPDTE